MFTSSDIDNIVNIATGCLILFLLVDLVLMPWSSERLGRFVNDLPKRQANCTARVVLLENCPHICLFATKLIPVGAELRYDYGGGNLTWRKVKFL